MVSVLVGDERSSGSGQVYNRQELEAGMDVAATVEDGDDQDHLRPNTNDDRCAFLKAADLAHTGVLAACDLSSGFEGETVFLFQHQAYLL